MTIRTVLLRGVIWVAIFFAVFSTALVLLFESGALTPSVVETVDKRVAGSGLSFHAAALQWRPWSGLSLADVLVATRATPDSTQALRRLVSVRRIEVGYRFIDFLKGNLRLLRVKVVAPDLDLDALSDWSKTMSQRMSGSRTMVRIEHLRLEDGRVRGPEGDILAGLTLDGKLEAGGGTWHATVDQAKTQLTLGRFHERVELSGELGMEEGILALDDVQLAAAGGTIGLRGRLDPRGEKPSEVFLSGNTVPLQKIGEWLGVEHPLLFADLQAEVAATGRPDSLRLSGDLAGRRGDDVERRIHFAGTRVGSRLALEAFRFRAESSLVDLTGQLDFNAGPSIEGVAVFRHLAPGTALADSDLSVISGVDGVIRFAGTGLTRRSFRGSADLRIEHANVFGVEVGAGTLQISLDSGALTLDSARLSVGGAELTGSGTISADNQVHAQFAGELPDLASLALPKGTLGEWVTQGSAQGRLELSGPLAGPSLDAALHLDHLSVAGVDTDTLDLTVTTDRIAQGGRWEFRATGTAVGHGERRFDRLAAEGFAEGQSVVVRSAELSDASGGLQLAGRLDAQTGGRLYGSIGRLELHAADDVRWVNHGPIQIERTPAALVLSGVDLRGRGTLAGRASFESSGRRSIHATGRAVDLAVLAPFLRPDKAVAGQIDFDADATFGADSVSGDVRVDVAQGRWGERTFDRLSGRVTFLDDRAKLEDITIVGSAGQSHATGEIFLPEGGLGRALEDSTARANALERAVFRHLDLRVAAEDFTWLWNRVPRVPATGGAGFVSVRLDGPFLGPSATLHVGLTGGTVGTVPLDSLTADATFDGEVLTVSYGSLRAGGGEVAFSGVVPLVWTTKKPSPSLREGHAMDLRLDAQGFPLGALATLIPLFNQLDGKTDAKLALKGEPGALAFEGDFTVMEGRLTIPTFADPLVDGAGTGSFDAKGVEITSARFSDGKDGVVEGRGRVAITNLRVTDYGLPVVARHYHYHSSFNGIRGEGSGRMEIVSAKTSDGRIIPLFTGSFRASRADIGEQALLPPSTETGGVEMPPGVVAPPEETEPDVVVLPQAAGPKAPVAFLADIKISGDGNLWLRTPETDCELAGDITFQVTERATGITGTVRTLRGTYSVLNTRFVVKRAEVEFVDPANPGASYIDAEATTTVLDENVTATVTGTVLEPQIRLTTESGMSEPEIYELLALRIKRDDPLAQDQGVINRAFRASAVAAITNRFGGRLGSEVGLDTFTYEEGVSGVRPSVTVGKNVGRDFFFKYKQAVGGQDASIDPSVTRESLESPERALTVEYRLNQMFLLQGETGTLPQGDDYLNVDLRAEWGY